MTRIGRGHGVLDSASGLIPFGHVGWGYRRRRDFARRAGEYLTDGIRHGQHVVYVGEGDVASLNAEIDALRRHLPVDVADAWIEVIPVGGFYTFESGGDVVDPDASVAARVAATEQAVGAGFSGFRAVVDATAVARTPEQREAFSTFEFLIDQKMARLPVSALCAYDVSQLGPSADRLICLHPYVNSAGNPARVYSGIDTDVAISGHVDLDAADGLIGALRMAWSRKADAQLTVDATAATGTVSEPAARFLTRLDEAAARDGVAVTVRTSSTEVIALIDGLRTDNIHAVATPTAPSMPVEQLHAQIAQLTNRIASAPTIEQAKGMLMQAFGVSDAAAFAILKQLSQDGNLMLRDVAEHLVSAWLHGGPRPDADAVTAFLLDVRDGLPDSSVT